MGKNTSGNPIKIVIVNSHTSLNSGDAGILIGNVNFLRKKFGEVNIIVASRTPVLDSQVYKNYDLKFLPPIIPTPLIIKSGTNKIKENLINFFSVRSRTKLLSSIKSCDIVISCGGANFFSNRKYFPGPMFFQNYLHVLLTVLFRKPLFFFPQSFGPFKNKASAFLIRSLLNSKKVKKIWAREEISFKILLDLVKNKSIADMCPDIAFLLELNKKEFRRTEFSDLPKPFVVLTMRSWSFPHLRTKRLKREKRAHYLNALVKTCIYVYEKLDGSLMFLPSSRGIKHLEDDRYIIEEIKNKLNSFIPEGRMYCPEIKDNENIINIISLISSADLVLATRFHPSIYAITSGIPVLSISYHHKCSGIMKMVNMERFSLPISYIEDKDIILKLEEILKNSANIKKDLTMNAKKIKKEIELKLYDELYPVVITIQKNKRNI